MGSLLFRHALSWIKVASLTQIHVHAAQSPKHGCLIRAFRLLISVEKNNTISMSKFSSLLAGGDRRSTGLADQVAATVAMHPERFEELWECLTHEDAVVRMRAADSLEKVTRENSACLQLHKTDLLSERLEDGTKEIRWHLLALCGRLQLTDHEAVKFMNRLRHYLETDDSKIVRVTALQTAFEISQLHGLLAAEMKELISCAKRSKVASLQSRARKLDIQVQSDR